MKTVIQRVSRASVTIQDAEVRSIGQGLLVLLGIGMSDEIKDVKWLAGKIARLRLFEDDLGKFNFSIVDLSAEVLVVSQFTLMGSTKRGNRPSWDAAAPAEMARPLYEEFIQCLGEIVGQGKLVQGDFGTMMEVGLVNRGPCTIIMDSKSRF